MNPWLGVEGYNCFGCCPTNSHGVKMEFYADADGVVSYWSPESCYQGWVNVLHGGIQAVLLDEVCAWAVMERLSTSGVTMRMETRYRHSVSVGEPYLVLRAHVEEVRRNLVTVVATLADSTGKVCTEATCTYFVFSHEKAQEMGFTGLAMADEDLTEAEVLARMGLTAAAKG